MPPLRNVNGDVQDDLANKILLDSFGDKSSPFEDAKLIEAMVYDEAYKAFGINGYTNTYDKDFNRFMSYDDYLAYTGEARPGCIDIGYLDFLLDNYNSFLHLHARLDYLICLANALRMFGTHLRKMKRGGNKGKRGGNKGKCTRKRRDKHRNKPYVRNRKYTVNNKRGRGTRKRKENLGGTKTAKQLKHVQATPLKTAARAVGFRRATLLAFIVGLNIYTGKDFLAKLAYDEPKIVDSVATNTNNTTKTNYTDVFAPEYDNNYNATWSLPDDIVDNVMLGAGATCALSILTAYSIILSNDDDGVCSTRFNDKDNKCPTETELTKEEKVDQFKNAAKSREQELIDTLKQFNGTILHTSFMRGTELSKFRRTFKELMHIQMKKDFDTRVEQYSIFLATNHLYEQAKDISFSNDTSGDGIMKHAKKDLAKALTITKEQQSVFTRLAEIKVAELFGMQIVGWLADIERENGQKAKDFFDTSVADVSTNPDTAAGKYNLSKKELGKTADSEIRAMARGLLLIEWSNNKVLPPLISGEIQSILLLYRLKNREMQATSLSNMIGSTVVSAGTTLGLVGLASVFTHLHVDPEFVMPAGWDGYTSDQNREAADDFLRKTLSDWNGVQTKWDGTKACGISFWNGNPFACPFEHVQRMNNGRFPYLFYTAYGWLWSTKLGQFLTCGEQLAKTQYLVTRVTQRGQWVLYNINGVHGIAAVVSSANTICQTYNNFADLQVSRAYEIDNGLRNFEFNFDQQILKITQDKDENAGGKRVADQIKMTMEIYKDSVKEFNIVKEGVRNEVHRNIASSTGVASLALKEKALGLDEQRLNVEKQTLEIAMKKQTLEIATGLEGSPNYKENNILKTNSEKSNLLPGDKLNKVVDNLVQRRMNNLTTEIMKFFDRRQFFDQRLGNGVIKQTAIHLRGSMPITYTNGDPDKHSYKNNNTIKFEELLPVAPTRPPSLKTLEERIRELDEPVRFSVQTENNEIAQKGTTKRLRA